MGRQRSTGKRAAVKHRQIEVHAREDGSPHSHVVPSGKPKLGGTLGVNRFRCPSASEPSLPPSVAESNTVDAPLAFVSASAPAASTRATRSHSKALRSNASAGPSRTTLPALSRTYPVGRQTKGQTHLYVGNLDPQIQLSQVKAHFSNCGGVICDARFSLAGSEDMYAQLMFDTPAAVHAALKMYGSQIDGFPLPIVVTPTVNELHEAVRRPGAHGLVAESDVDSLCRLQRARLARPGLPVSMTPGTVHRLTASGIQQVPLHLATTLCCEDFKPSVRRRVVKTAKRLWNGQTLLTQT
ncbi:unnamed protein product [Mycena citricolor]|uniref:RRM domain-containing protein n=1 Tax=Mycena citricolor TaxID=2018698 RepID=A0AAD2HF96_9AGAR|nr:unnamed protein product [Mycena citricolor]